MSDVQKCRKLLAEADRERKFADGAENLMRSLRLGAEVEAKPGILRFFGGIQIFAGSNDKAHVLDGWEQAALHDYLIDCQAKHLAAAAKLEQQVVSDVHE